MIALAADHSTAGAIVGGTLRQRGYGAGILRYACGGRGDVNITPAEIRDLNANRIPVGIVLEHEADWLHRTADTIATRALASRAICRACGLPDGPIYMAADWDVTASRPASPGTAGENAMQRILASLNVAARFLGPENVGFYGGYFAVDWLAQHAPWIRWHWQTAAWSSGHRHPKAVLYQRAQSDTVARVSIDVDEILAPRWGQRTLTPTPPPKAAARASGTFRAELAYDHDRQAVHVTPLAGDVKRWGDIDEWIRLEADLRVGPTSPGAWRGRVLGATNATGGPK